MKKPKRTNRESLQRMAEDWRVNPERAAARIKRSLPDRLAAEFKIATRATKQFSEAMNGLTTTLQNHFYLPTEVGPGSR